MARCVKVRRKEAEKLRQKLIAQGLFDPGFVPLREGDFVFFAVKKQPKGTKVVAKELMRRQRQFASVHEALAGRLAKGELEELVRSFDVVGDVAIVEIPEGLKLKEGAVARAVMEVHRNVKVVAKKMGPMEGEFRVRKLKVIGGEKRTETTYKEHGVKMKLDLAKVYFSPRLAFERSRIAELVESGENILAMFAGVGPFPLVIARRKPKVKIAAVELNPDAVRFMRENVKMNRLGESITPILGDVRTVVPKKFRGWADRILMPLPKGAHEFLHEAFVAAKKGAVVHFYTFGKVGSKYEDAVKLVKEAAEKEKRKVKVLNVRTVRPYAPDVDQVVVDFRVA